MMTSSLNLFETVCGIYRIKRILWGILLCFLIVYPGLSFSAVLHPYAVWATPESEKLTGIDYAEYVDSHWEAPRHLDIGRGLHVTPVIAVDKHQVVWIVWVEQTENENILRYARIANGRTKSGRVTMGHNEQSYAPAIVIDAKGQPWISWSAVVGRFADVFSSKWNGSSWEKPMLVNEANDLPDITPLMGVDKTGPWVSWLGITVDHRFVQFIARWRNNGWHVDKETYLSKNILQFIQERMVVNDHLPQQADHRLMGAFFSPSGPEIQSISERFIHFQPLRKRND